MCTKPKISSPQQVRKDENQDEIIKQAVQADAQSQKPTPANQLITRRGLISENIRTTNNGLEDEIVSTKKKLLGE